MWDYLDMASPCSFLIAESHARGQKFGVSEVPFFFLFNNTTVEERKEGPKMLDKGS